MGFSGTGVSLSRILALLAGNTGDLTVGGALVARNNTATVVNFGSVGTQALSISTSPLGVNVGAIFNFTNQIVNTNAGNSTGTPGAATLNTPTGRSAFAAAASSLTITNSLVSATSIVWAVLQTADGTLTSILRVVPAAGSFTITGNAAATAATNVGWVVFN